MFLGLVKDKNLIPAKYFDTIYDIDFLALYQEGFRLILTDLDNTLESYKTPFPSNELKELIKKIQKIGFEIMIVSNNFSNKRVKIFAEELDIPFISRAFKPTTGGYRRALKFLKHQNRKDVITLGDQLFTDVFSSNKMGFYSIVVRAIDRKTEVWTTRFNRHLEQKAFKRLSKKNLLTEEALRYFEGGNHA